jgi:CHAT domain-containing protein
VSRRPSVPTRLLATLLALAAGARPLAAAQEAAAQFEACTPVSGEWSYDDFVCLYRVGAEQRRMAEARARLRRLGAGDPAHPWATLVLGHATLNDDAVAAIAHYETAAAGFGRIGEAEGEVIARQNLRLLFRRRGDAAAAAHQVELAVAAAAVSNRPLTIARASVLEAAELVDSGNDVGRARRALIRAEQLAFPDGPIALRRAILFQLANADLYLGLLDEAIDALERHRALRQEDRSTADAAAVAFNLLNAHVARQEARPVTGARSRLVRMAADTVTEIQSLDRPFVEAQAHRILGDLLRSSDPDRAAVHLRRCLALERPLHVPAVRAACLWSLSLLEGTRDPTAADRLSNEAISLASAGAGGPLLAFAWQARLRLAWQTLPESNAIPESLEALDAIERLRAAQPDARSRAALFGNWTGDYYRLTGRLLESGPTHLDRAFDVGERLRARVLLDRLARAGTPVPGPDRARALSDLARRIADTQRGILTAPSAEQREALEERLTLMEIERRELGGNDVPIADPSKMPFGSLESVRRALAPGEAMLWFSVAPWKDLYDEFGGGAWVVTITTDAARVHRLATRVEIDSKISAWRGLLRRRSPADGAWSPAARHLGQALLGSALAALPASVTRLVIVSDGVLHTLPFEALRTEGDPRTFGERFEIAVVPSATLWLRLRGAVRPPGTTAMVLADPDLPPGGGTSGFRLGPLPAARREGRAIASALGLDAASVREGAAASEHALKQTPLAAVDVLHLAVHARADARFPERSAVFLAAGAPDEDGWLQPPEIASLGLDGALVVLSACESANGALVAGEGPLSLARAFFAGGAGSVIATRWPLRDDDAAFMMARFYRALGSGATVAAALRQARLEAMADGRPAEVWAGFALLGDGSATPVRVPAASPLRALLLLAAVVAAGVGLVRGLGRSRRSTCQ